MPVTSGGLTTSKDVRTNIEHQKNIHHLTRRHPDCSILSQCDKAPGNPVQHLQMPTSKQRICNNRKCNLFACIVRCAGLQLQHRQDGLERQQGQQFCRHAQCQDKREHNYIHALIALLLLYLRVLINLIRKNHG